MTDAEIQDYLTSLTDTARPEADAHYAGLYAKFLETVPECLHRSGEYAPSPTRPSGFNADSTGFQFYLRLEGEYAQTYALFVYKRKKKVWFLKHFGSIMQLDGYAFAQTFTYSLPQAIFAAHEMWMDRETRRRAAGMDGEVQEASSKQVLM